MALHNAVALGSHRLERQAPRATHSASGMTSREVEDPPDGGYGWVCVAACFTINCFTWGTVAVSSCFRVALRTYNHFTLLVLHLVLV